MQAFTASGCALALRFRTAPGTSLGCTSRSSPPTLRAPDDGRPRLAEYWRAGAHHYSGSHSRRTVPMHLPDATSTLLGLIFRFDR